MHINGQKFKVLAHWIYDKKNVLTLFALVVNARMTATNACALVTTCLRAHTYTAVVRTQRQMTSWRGRKTPSETRIGSIVTEAVSRNYLTVTATAIGAAPPFIILHYPSRIDF